MVWNQGVKLLVNIMKLKKKMMIIMMMVIITKFCGDLRVHVMGDGNTLNSNHNNNNYNN